MIFWRESQFTLNVKVLLAIMKKQPSVIQVYMSKHENYTLQRCAVQY